MDWLFHNYLTRGFWRDEAWTALIAALPISEIIRVTGEDFHPPFYYLLVYGFIRIFGSSEWIRLISVVFWGLIPWPVYWLMRKAAGKTVAVSGVILILMSPSLFIYAFEARSYALLAWLSAVTTWTFWKSMATKKSQWLIAYSMAAVAGMYTHYYMWFIIAVHGLTWLWWYRQQVWRYLLVWGGLIAAQLPWIPTILSQVTSVKNNYWIGQIDRWTHWEWFVVVAGGDTDQPQRMFVVWTILLLLMASPVLVRWRYRKWPKAYLYLWLWLLVPVVIPTVISVVFKPVFFYRYLIFSSMPMLLIVTWGLAAVRKSIAFGGVAFLLAFYVTINGLNFFRFPVSMREKLEKVFASNKEAKMLVTELLPFPEVMYYNRDRLPVRVTRERIRQDYGKALLDAYVRRQLVTVGEAPTDQSYWLMKLDSETEYHE